MALGWLADALWLLVGPPTSIDVPPVPTPAVERAEMREQQSPPPAMAPLLRRRIGLDERVPIGPRQGDVLGDRQVGRARVHVRADGSVSIDAPPSVALRPALCIAFQCLGPRGARRQSKKTIPFATAPVLFGIGGTFGYAPVSPRPVVRMLAETREARQRMAIAEQRRRLARSPAEMSARLAALLHDRSLEPASLRAIVFELWDDAGCSADVESNEEPLAAETAATRAAVQTRVEMFVRRFMPRGSDVGYTDSMLARFDARRCSARTFRPYASVAASSESTPAAPRVIAPLDHPP
jgi:hypothetical protein